MNSFKNLFFKLLNEEIDVSGSPEIKDATQNFDEMGTEAVKNTTTPEAYQDLTNELDDIKDASSEDVSYEQIINLGKKYSVFFEKVREVIDKVQDGQLSNRFHDCFDADLSGLDRKLADVSSQLKAGIKARAMKQKADKNKENYI